jgi:hypothetical protein
VSWLYKRADRPNNKTLLSRSSTHKLKNSMYCRLRISKPREEEEEKGWLVYRPEVVVVWNKAFLRARWLRQNRTESNRILHVNMDRPMAVPCFLIWPCFSKWIKYLLYPDQADLGVGKATSYYDSTFSQQATRWSRLIAISLTIQHRIAALIFQSLVF